MNTKNTMSKVEKFLRTEFSVEPFSDINMGNCIETHAEYLKLEGINHIKDILTLKYLDPEKKHYDNYRDILKKIFPIESLDPKKEYLPINYFARTQVWEKISHEFTRLVNNIEGEGEIVFITCAMNTGKTLSQNIWIKENDILMENKKIFWVRCDCEKLVKLVESVGIDKLSTKEDDIIGNYFDIQFLSVLCKNYQSEERPFFRQIIQELEGKTIKSRISGDYKEPKYEYNVPIINLIEEYHKRILESKIKGEKYNYGRDTILKDALGNINKNLKAFENWCSLSKEIQKILIEKGYKFLQIIDSVDNYKKYDNYGDYQRTYTFILEKIRIFINNYAENQKHKGHVVVISRKNTYADYCAVSNQSKRESRHGEDLHYCPVSPNNLQGKNAIQERRYKYLEENVAQSETMEIFKKVINFKIPEPSFLYEFLKHDKHIGNLLFNKLSLVPALIYFKKKYEINIDNLDAFIENYLPPNLLLNGHFSLNSFSQLGKMLFNIFFYEHEDEKFEGVKWQGLCCTRILQYLHNEKEGIYKNDLTDKIHELFCYDKNEIKKKISQLIEFSLLRLDRKEGNLKQVTDVNNPKIFITKKGICSLNLIYSDFDILYHCSLNTPIPKSLIKNSFIFPHSNEIEIKNYAICCLKSTSSFIQYLKKIDREERTYIKNLNIGINSQDYILPFDANNEILSCLENRMGILYKSLNDKAIKEFDDFLDKFKEVKVNFIPIKKEERSDVIFKRNPKKDDKTITVAIASPSKTIDREKFINTLERNFRDKGYEKRCGFRLIVRGFEDIASQPGEPQIIINEKIIQNSDFVVAIFKHHLGTPTPRAISGTVEELLQGLDKSNKDMPIGMAYFYSKETTIKISNVSKAKQTIQKIDKLSKFKKSIQNRMILGKWSSQNDLENKILSDLEKNITDFISMTND
ncbi:MAG: hypothetical protein FWC41_06015 [Firmicutes bacterium]|nr:hypothetical protein [Bacillota bacterium]